MKLKRLSLSLVISLLISCLAAFTGCDVVPGSGVTQTFELNYANFTRLEISAGFDMEITQADSFFVSVTIDKALYEYLNIAQRGDTLHIGLKPNNTYAASQRVGIIRLPDIRRLDLSGGAKADVTGFTMTHDMDFELSGASTLVLNPMQAGDTSFTLSGASTATGNIRINNCRLGVSGASKLTLTGTAKDIKVSAAGASTVTLKDFPVTTAGIELSGASRAAVTVSDVMDVKLSGASDLEYSGNPKMGGIDISGGSKFNQVTP
jgi:hypothetical protein